MGSLEGTSTERVYYFDIAKGIGMLSVIAGHMGISYVNAFVFTYHMPLFFLISGWFFNDKPGKLRKNAIHLLIPYAITVVVIGMIDALKALLKNMFTGVGGYSLRILLETLLSGLYGSGSRTDTIFRVDIPTIGAIWFLLALFWGLILLKVITRIDKLPIRVVVVIICFVLGVVSSKFVWLPFSIQPAFCALLFLYIGWEFKTRWNGKFTKGNKWTILACILVWIVALVASYANTNMSIVRCAFPNGILDIVGAVVASWLIVRLSMEIENLALLAKPLEFFGENSLMVMCVHLVELSCFPWSIVYRVIPYKIVAVTLVFVCKVLFNVVSVIVVKKIATFVRSIIAKREI